MVLRNLVLCLVLISISAGVHDVRGQRARADSVTWKTDLVGKLSASQAGYRNWAEGGTSSLALTVSAAGKATRAYGTWGQTHEVRFAFGLLKQDSLEVRKAEDVVRIVSSLRYSGGSFFSRFSPTLAFQVRTQFAPGFNYEKDPFDSGLSPPVKVSDLMSPGTFSQALGLTYTPDDGFKQRVGFGVKETVVLIERLRPLYGLGTDQAVKLELGAESRTEVDREVLKNVRLTSSLGLFAAFNQPDLPDLLWENLLDMKVNKYLSVNVEFVALYDRDISSRVQVKEVLSLGVSVEVL